MKARARANKVKGEDGIQEFQFDIEFNFKNSTALNKSGYCFCMLSYFKLTSLLQRL